MPEPRLRAPAVAAAVVTIVAALGAAACGSTSVGNSSLFSFTPAPVSTPTPSATAVPSEAATAVATAAPAKTAAPKTAAPATRAPTAAPTAVTQAQHFAIAIQSDSANPPGFNPPVAAVYAGTIVDFTNRDAVARSVVADNGAFSSGPIAPGATWSYTAGTAGDYPYHDGTRPYTVAQLQVKAR